MKYKLVSIDLDGTLLNDEKKISKDNKLVLQELYARGVEVVIATGRRYYSAKEFASQLDIKTTIMANNGIIVRDMADDKLITSRYFDNKDFFNVINEGKQRELHAITHVDYYSDGYDVLVEFEKNDKRYSGYLGDIANRYKTIDSFLKHSDPRALAIVYTGEVEKLREFQQNLNDKYRGKYNAYLMHNLKDVGSMLEIINSKGSKWVSTLEYANNKGIKKEEIIAIGDDNNDIEMIKNAGLGIAMKNATDEVKKSADIITYKDNNDSGLGHVLKDIFKIIK